MVVVNGIKNGVDDGDSVVLGKRGQSKRALRQWQVQRRGSFCMRLEDRQCWVVESRR